MHPQLEEEEEEEEEEELFETEKFFLQKTSNLTCSVVSRSVEIRGSISVREANACRRVQEQHVRHCRHQIQSEKLVKEGFLRAHTPRRCIKVESLREKPPVFQA